MAVPVIGRLSPTQYLRIVFAFTVLILEPLVRLLFWILPLRHLADLSRRLFSSSRTHHAAAAPGDQPRPDEILERLNNTDEFCRFWGYPIETHYVTTPDGYILALHRIPGSRGERRAPASRVSLRQSAASRQRQHDSAQRKQRPAVLLWHGFLMCSEVWVCTPDTNLSLAFTLADAGYDVWMGNTRGNKYSCKHISLKPNQDAFWDFSMDHLVLHDLPASVDYVLKTAGAPSLSYVGFSQGTAQGFAALSLSRELNQKINLFIALAPVARPHGLENKTVQSLVNASHELIYLLFGRRVILSTALFWRRVLTPLTHAWVIDLATWFLFHWRSEWIPHKNVVYRHLYSYTSVKVVVHWFQIIRRHTFQMYDEDPSLFTNEGHLIPRFPMDSVTVPTALFYGGKDTLPDMGYILSNSPAPVFCLQIREYEHLHFLWARGLDKIVYPGILGLLATYSECWRDLHESVPLQTLTTRVIKTPPAAANAVDALSPHARSASTSASGSVSVSTALAPSESPSSTTTTSAGTLAAAASATQPQLQLEPKPAAVAAATAPTALANQRPSPVLVAGTTPAPGHGLAHRSTGHDTALSWGGVGDASDAPSSTAVDLDGDADGDADSPDEAELHDLRPRHLRTVPWISRQQIMAILEAGQGRVVDKQANLIVFDGRVSVKRYLKRHRRTTSAATFHQKSVDPRRDAALSAAACLRRADLAAASSGVDETDGEDTDSLYHGDLEAAARAGRVDTAAAVRNAVPPVKHSTGEAAVETGRVADLTWSGRGRPPARPSAAATARRGSDDASRGGWWHSPPRLVGAHAHAGTAASRSASASRAAAALSPSGSPSGAAPRADCRARGIFKHNSVLVEKPGGLKRRQGWSGLSQQEPVTIVSDKMHDDLLYARIDPLYLESKSSDEEE